MQGFVILVDIVFLAMFLNDTEVIKSHKIQVA